MIEAVRVKNYSSAAGTVVVFVMGASIASCPTVWPQRERPTYISDHAGSSHSPFIMEMEHKLATDHNVAFAEEIASIFASIASGQEPLGEEFEAVWDANIDILYES